MNKKRFLLPLLSILFFFGCSYQPVRAVDIPSISPAKKVLIGVGSAGAFYGYKLIKHFWKLHTIEKELQSSIVSSNRNPKLPFVAWRNAQFNTPDEIANNAKDVASSLKKDSNSGYLVVYQHDGSMLDSKRASPDLVKELQREKEILKNWLSDIANMCDAPGCIIDMIVHDEDFLSSLHDGLSDNEKLLQCIERDVHTAKSHENLNDVRFLLEQQGPPHVASWVLFRPNWKPWCWVVGPCYKKARRIYFEVFKQYVRLKALQGIVETSLSTATLKKSLQSISSDTQQLNTDRASIDGNNVLKRAWITRLGNLEAKVETLSVQDGVSREVSGALNDILETFKTVGMQIFQPMAPHNDPIVRLLNQAKQKVDELTK